ncbi:MAG: metallophosphoesterase family protein [Undibacterium sp.]|nr:metallophosphoesterase family protein [Opitutaceae bacterium]
MRLRHRFTFVVLLTAALSTQAATTITRGPYLQLPTPTSLVIRWRTDVTEASVVRYGLDPKELTLTAKAEGIGTEHIVNLPKLQPGTRYFYVPITGNDKPVTATASEDAAPKGLISSFVTPPVPGPAKPTRVWVLGDPGTKSAEQSDVRDGYYKFTGDRATDLWLLLGDNAYPEGTDSDYQKAIFEMYPKTLRTSPLWPALGNHDAKSANSVTQSGVYYDIFTLPTLGQVGGVPSGTEAYYSFDHANIHFICLDSHDSDRSAEGAMAQWLRADLAATTRDWIVAFFHHPTYTKGTHDSDQDSDSAGRMNDMRATILPILEAGGVDLVVTGHSHVYERSYFIDGHYGKSSTWDPAFIKQPGDGRPAGKGAYTKPRTRTAHAGEVSVVTGSAGHAGPKSVPLGHPAMFVSLNEIGSSVLDIDALKLDFTFLNEKGEIRDSFTILKQ